MGSPLSLVIAYLYMVFLEQLALQLTTLRLKFWQRCVDITFVMWSHEDSKLNQFMDQLNGLCPTIQLTMERKRMARFPSLMLKVRKQCTQIILCLTMSLHSYPWLISSFSLHSTPSYHKFPKICHL